MKTLNKSKTSLFLKIGIVTLVMVIFTTMTIFSQKASASILGELADSNGTVSKEYKPDPDSRASMRWKSDGWKSEPNTDPNRYCLYEESSGEKPTREYNMKVYDMKVNDEKFCYGLGGGEADIFYRFEMPKYRIVAVAMDVMLTKTNEKGIIESYGLYGTDLSHAAQELMIKGSADRRFREKDFKEGNKGILNEAIAAKLGLGGSDSSYTYEMYVDRLTITVESRSDSIFKEYVCDPDFRASMSWRSDGWKSEHTDPNSYCVYRQKFDDEGNVKDVKEVASVYDIKVDYQNFLHNDHRGYEGNIFCQTNSWGIVFEAMDVMIRKIDKEGKIVSYGLYKAITPGYELSSSVQKKQLTSTLTDNCLFRENDCIKGQREILAEAVKAKEGEGDSNFTYEVYVDRLTIKWIP